jgi:hypothetical protein
MHKVPTIALLASLLTAPINGAEADDARTLFIAIDAIPYSVMVELASDPDNAFFHSLRGPAPVISTFPSTTSLALAAMLEPLGVENSPGYEAKHYLWEENEVTGGGLLSYEPFPWREFFDWKIEGLWRKATSAIRPIKAARKDVRQSLRAFAESSDDVFFIYYDTTDSAGHLRSPEGLKPILQELDRSLSELREQSERPFHAVLFSDHGLAGGDPLVNARKAVKRALKQAGYKTSGRIRSERDVVFVPFGLVSSFVVYSHPGEESAVAAAMAEAQGVQLCAYSRGEGWGIASGSGSATLERRVASAPQWRYDWQGDDPLKLGDHLHQLFADAAWVDDREVFEHTVDQVYPDPFHRIARSFELVENPASVACSVAPGYMYGAKMTATASKMSVGALRWTHGALDRTASLGFVMSDAPGWQANGALRFDQVLRPFMHLEHLEPSLASR